MSSASGAGSPHGLRPLAAGRRVALPALRGICRGALPAAVKRQAHCPPSEVVALHFIKRVVMALEVVVLSVRSKKKQVL